MKLKSNDINQFSKTLPLVVSFLIDPTDPNISRERI